MQKFKENEGNLKEKDFKKAWRLNPPPDTKTYYKVLAVKTV